MKFMLLQNYGSVEADIGPMTEWKAGGGQDPIHFQKEHNVELRERGELIEGTALTAPELAKFVVADGKGAPVVTDAPFPESKELLACFRVVDVESLDRALEIATITS